VNYKAIIEIPKNCDRRIHMRYDGSGFEDFGPIKDKIPVNDGAMPVAYGYIVDAINKDEKDNVDVLVFSNREYKTGDEMDVRIFGLMNRDDGDHKILAVDSTVEYKSFDEIPADEQKLIMEYFGYQKNIMIMDGESADEYLKECLVN
jgi:inorganic pyrophosphatase